MGTLSRRLLYVSAKTFRTRVVRDSKNPQFNERVHLYVKQSDFDADWAVRLSVFDYETLGHNEQLGTATVPIQELVEKCPFKEGKENEPSAFDHVLVELVLNNPNQKVFIGSLLTLQSNTPASLKIQCKFIPYRGKFKFYSQVRYSSQLLDPTESLL